MKIARDVRRQRRPTLVKLENLALVVDAIGHRNVTAFCGWR